MTWADIKHFTPAEFDSKDAPGSGARMDLSFVAKLDALRDTLGVPLIVNSGYRTQARNAQVGGVDSSAHETGHAADISAPSSGSKFKIVAAAMKLGFTRVGLGNTFVHLDDDPTHAQEVLWTYPDSVKRG